MAAESKGVHPQRYQEIAVKTQIQSAMSLTV